MKKQTKGKKPQIPSPKKSQEQKQEISAAVPKRSQQGMTVKKEKDISEWYTEVVQKAELADYSPIKGFMIIRPNAYSIWEKIQENFNEYLKKKNIKNAYFPLLIPESFFRREAEHAKGFAPELAWIEKNSGEEGERLAIRPTSETIIYDSFSKWIRSWRDLPLKINQWCNVLRWEVKQTKPFLRTREFLWQEGHCVYETEKECDKEVIEILNEYEKICKELLAIPVLKGRKTKNEKFAGAYYTTTIEALMPDGKALQMGTSHNLGQGFANAFGIKFKDKNEKLQVPWQSSWGISTRLIGAVILTHGDDRGLVLPPKIAPIQIAIVPILLGNKEKILKKAREIKKSLNEYSAEIDEREEYTPGWKFSEYELKGVPLRIEIGPKDIEKNQVVFVRRDNGIKEVVKEKDIRKKIKDVFEKIHDSLYEKAKKFLYSSIIKTEKFADFAKAIEERKIALAPFCEGESCENSIKEKTQASSRLISDEKSRGKKCVSCGKSANYLVYFAKSY